MSLLSWLTSYEPAAAAEEAVAAEPAAAPAAATFEAEERFSQRRERPSANAAPLLRGAEVRGGLVAGGWGGGGGGGGLDDGLGGGDFTAYADSQPKKRPRPSDVWASRVFPSGQQSRRGQSTALPRDELLMSNFGQPRMLPRGLPTSSGRARDATAGMAFDRSGALLAVATRDGRALVHEFDQLLTTAAVESGRAAAEAGPASMLDCKVLPVIDTGALGGGVAWGEANVNELYTWSPSNNKVQMYDLETCSYERPQPQVFQARSGGAARGAGAGSHGVTALQHLTAQSHGFVAGGRDGCVHIFDPRRSSTPTATVKQRAMAFGDRSTGTASVGTLQLSPDGQLLVVATTGTLVTGYDLRVMGAPKAIAFGSVSKQTGEVFNVLCDYTWSVQGGPSAMANTIDARPLYSVVLNPDGRHLVYQTEDGSVGQYDLLARSHSHGPWRAGAERRRADSWRPGFIPSSGIFYCDDGPTHDSTHSIRLRNLGGWAERSAEQSRRVDLSALGLLRPTAVAFHPGQHHCVVAAEMEAGVCEGGPGVVSITTA